ncbi:MAG TPA: ferredoxin reductase family protein [Streptosporangiaceae bacterium]|nr:ferredoxin reductase family protein [Streptosporangiaceae bacterium]
MSAPPAGFDASPRTRSAASNRRPVRGRESLSREKRPPRPGLLKAALVVVGAGLGATTALAITAETSSQLAARGGIATFIGSITGLVGTYLALVMVLLVSRIPFVEGVLGQDGLLRWHRRLAPWPISLIIAHAVFITVGYAQAAKSGLWHQVGVLITQYPDILTATVALGLMCLAGAISIRAIRRRVRRETWWLVHLYLYLALAISFAHVIVLGPSFVGHPLTQFVWSAAWLATAGLVLCYRFGLPIVRSLRHRLRVVEVRSEGPEVTSVIVAGRDLDRLAVAGGQFFLWRFLTRGMWWQAHPYSLSAMPRPPYLRLTVKGVGDHSTALAGLRPGTPILVEGPYGAFTRHALQRPRALLIAGGIGVTALRSLLEDLPRSASPTVILRATSEQDLVLRDEVRDLVQKRKGRVHEILGSRQQARIDEKGLRRLVPDLDKRDVFVCGPAGFVEDVVGVVTALGVPEESIHHEAFAL